MESQAPAMILEEWTKEAPSYMRKGDFDHTRFPQNESRLRERSSHLLNPSQVHLPPWSTNSHRRYRILSRTRNTHWNELNVSHSTLSRTRNTHWNELNVSKSQGCAFIPFLLLACSRTWKKISEVSLSSLCTSFVKWDIILSNCLTRIHWKKNNNGLR